MTRQILIAVLSTFLGVCAASAQEPFTCQGQYYLSLSESLSSNSGLFLVEIDPFSGAVVFTTVSASVGANVNAIGYRSVDNFIYGIDPDEFFLYRLGADGIAVFLGIPQGMVQSTTYFAGDLTPDGKFLVLLGQESLQYPNGLLAFVDLESPNFQVTNLPLNGSTSNVFDIAFDPFSGDCYGYSGGSSRLLKIDINSGNVDANFPPQPQVDHLGALFFDSFGNLFGYGATNGSLQNKLVALDINTGLITIVTQGPDSEGNDGCSCPYTIELKKVVSTPIALPCTEVVYSFIISNGSGGPQTGIQLADEMPAEFTILDILSNPFGGDIVVNGNYMEINEMTVPAGNDTIHVLVEIGEDALGLYKNQAMLTGLPQPLGSFTVSDDPFTLPTLDSTSLFIQPLDITFIQEQYRICKEDSITIDATLYGVTYLWENGSTDPIRVLSEEGFYSVTVTSPCEYTVADIEVIPHDYFVDIIPDEVEIELGEFASLNSIYQAEGVEVFFEWTDPLSNSLSCIDCQNTTARPFYDVIYTLTMTTGNGCVLEDQVSVRVHKDRSVYIPNMISSNSDGINDYFFVQSKRNNVRITEMRIFNRWGGLVFQSGEIEVNMASAGWDGSIDGNPAQVGVYVYLIELAFLDGVNILKSGDVTVIR